MNLSLNKKLPPNFLIFGSRLLLHFSGPLCLKVKIKLLFNAHVSMQVIQVNKSKRLVDQMQVGRKMEVRE